MRLLATGLRNLNFIVFPLEMPAVLLDRCGLFHKVLRTILLVDPGAVPLCRPLNHRSNLGERGHLAPAAIFLVVPARKYVN
jgi:hypothetical protein